jgi:hypothetical protein
MGFASTTPSLARFRSAEAGNPPRRPRSLHRSERTTPRHCFARLRRLKLAGTAIAKADLAERVGQLEALVLIGPRIEVCLRARPRTFHPRGIVRVKLRPLVQSARMGEHVPAASLVHVEANHLPAEWTLCLQGVKPPPTEELQ